LYFFHNGGSNTATGALYLGGAPSSTTGAFATANYYLSAGSLSAAAEFMGFNNNSNSNRNVQFAQTGGLNTVTGSDTSGLFIGGITSSYTMSGANNPQLLAPNLYLGYTPPGGQVNPQVTFDQQSGNTHLTGSGSNGLFLAYSASSQATLNLSGGSLTVDGTAYLGYAPSGTASVTHSGGTFTAATAMYIGPASASGTSVTTYSLSGSAVVSTPALYVRPTGALNASGGRITGGAIYATGPVNLTGNVTFDSNLPLGVGLGNALNINGTLHETGTIAPTNYTFSGTGTLAIEPTGTLTGSGLLSLGAIVNSGSITASAGNLTIPSGTPLNNGGGTLQNAAGSNLFVQSVSLTNAGNITVNSQGSVGFAIPVVNTSGHSVKLAGGTLSAPSLNNLTGANITGGGQLSLNLTNSGIASFTTASQVTGAVLNQSPGSITASGAQLIVNGTITNHGSVRATAGGAITADGPLDGGDGAARVDPSSSLRAAFFRQGSLSLFGTAGAPATYAIAAVKPRAQGGDTSVLASLSIQTDGAGKPLGQLDLADTALIVEYAAPGSSPIVSIRGAIKNAFAAGAWTGSGITSSVAATDPNKAVGYAEAADVLTFTAGHAPFAGQTVDPTSVLARYTFLGDANLDGSVGFNDLVRLAQSYNTDFNTNPTTNSWWSRGDFNYDGVVNFADLVKLAQNYNQSLPAGPVESAFTSVPEPTIIPILFAACGLAAPRRRHRLRTSLLGAQYLHP
jgi:hypothetical protein